jgi:hypothetical protein
VLRGGYDEDKCSENFVTMPGEAEEFLRLHS